jgi:hypothetical protein
VLGRSPPGQSGAVSATTALAAAAAAPCPNVHRGRLASEWQRACRTAAVPVPERSRCVTRTVGTYTRRIGPKNGRETAVHVSALAAPPNVSLPLGHGARRWTTMVLQFSLVLGRRSGGENAALTVFIGHSKVVALPPSSARGARAWPGRPPRATASARDSAPPLARAPAILLHGLRHYLYS